MKSSIVGKFRAKMSQRRESEEVDGGRRVHVRAGGAGRAVTRSKPEAAINAEAAWRVAPHHPIFY